MSPACKASGDPAPTTALFAGITCHFPIILREDWLLFWFYRFVKSSPTSELGDLLFLLSRRCVNPSAPSSLNWKVNTTSSARPDEAIQGGCPHSAFP